MTGFSVTPWDIPAAALALIACWWAGEAHVRSLKRVTELFLEGSLSAVGLQLLRFAAVAALLGLCAWAGPLPLVAGCLGLILGRRRALRKARGMESP
ncbi:hypothetical protein P2H44_23120 [Albimonas sp. CAU 1670]|uniref:hypothetical protein n=1 Tax=Albimonas sp. CAU 1670 TaxID=3032599 RepID=UPI0023DB8B46|nr:hypothetical protein [Albimonas sp. CAU 1670]MDF2235458.1 hypothetical protein [Albimonas sp. CAU 1670]